MLKKKEAIRSLFQVIDLLIHVVGGFHHLGIGLISALAHDQVNEFIHDADVGLFGVTLHQRAQTLRPSRGPHRIAGRIRRLKEILADAVQARRDCEVAS